MTTPVLLVDPDKVRARLGIAAPMDDTVKERIEEAILDSQSKVASHLNRGSLVAVEKVLTAVYADDMYELTDPRAWPAAAREFDDRYRVVSYTVNANEDDRFDVTFMVGLDVAGDPECAPIIQFIARDAAADLHQDPLFTAIERPVQSVSAEGQSVSYARPLTGVAAVNAAGSGLTLDSLKRFRRITIGRINPQPLTTWPYYSNTPTRYRY